MCRTLLVDDFVPFRELLATILSLYTNFDIVGQAGDGFQATEMTADLQPDLVIMDLNMPLCDGAEATRSIMSRFPNTIIILLTDSVDKMHIQRAIKNGAVGCLAKGMTAQQLTASLHYLIEQHQMMMPSV